MLCALLAAVLVGCGGVRSEAVDRTLSEHEALDRIGALITSTAAVLRPHPRLEPLTLFTVPGRCQASDGGAGRIVVSRAYWLREVPARDNVHVARQVVDEWTRQGHTLVGTGGFESGHPNVSALSRPDGFVLALAWAEGDHLYLAATSPCVRPDRTPAP
ncbi:hypothetical protein GCM10009530_02220 [Microbispora corallina]